MRFYIAEKLPKELKFLIFKNIKIESMSKIIINKSCEYLKLDTCNGCFDVQKAKNLKKVIFVNCITVFDNHTWKCIYLDSDNHNMYKIKNITFPDNIRSVVFERIITKKKLIMIINAACEEISIDTCECHFDLSKIVRLRSIKLIYQECHRYEIVLPDLTHVKTLEMSCDKLCCDFEKLLTECINATKLILHNIKCDLHDQTKTVTCFFPVKDDFSLALNQFMSNSESQNDSPKCNQPTIFAIDLGLYFYIIFKRHRYKTLQYLSISGISLDERGLKFIKNFIMLKTLSMVFQNILSNIFIALPPGLEQFIITPILCQQNQELKIIPGKILFNENANMCHKMLKILRIYLGLIVNKSQLVPFLVAIDTLEIIPAIVEWCPDPLNNRKVKVRKLVILKVDCELKKIVEETSTMEEYYDGVLDLLAYFVDFSDITQIIVQDENSERFVNLSDYMS
ncbi:putative LRR containing protein [Trachipleistophora hominis]|uniref:Putative LRR containing protein n=1 Tax=Trachipleistophora hominis TaxID=72359 RepID=L7JSH6_TRAHO|nr:putative LRR containing protein [Trachipleistophora hominis]